MSKPPNIGDVIATLRGHAPALRAKGVAHAAIFGSLARGEAQDESDIDILLEMREGAEIDLFAYAGLKRTIEELFDWPVDVIDRDALKPALRGLAERDAVYAF